MSSNYCGLLTVSVVLASACSMSPESSISPESGTYTVVPTTISDDCQLGIGMAGSVPIDVDVEGDSFTFDVSPCTLDGADFICDWPPYEWDGREQGYDRKDYWTYEVGGAWSADDAFSGDMKVHATCEGSDCELPEESCDTEGEFSAERSGPLPE